MKRKILFTVLWMLGFAVVAFSVWGTVLVPLIHTHRHLFEVIYSDAIFQSIFLVAPLVALWLGWRGKLPGTKKKEIDAAQPGAASAD